MIRTILSPGVELNEVDKSQYVSDVGTLPRALIMGFASQGPVQTTTEITSMVDFRRIYGTPTNEVERYFYNAVDQQLAAGSTVAAAKIPYENDDKFYGIKYKVEGKINLSAKGPIDELDAESYLETVSTRETRYSQDNDLADVNFDEKKEATIVDKFKKTDSSITDLVKVYPTKALKIDNSEFIELEGDYRGSDTVVSEMNTFVIVDKTKGVYKSFTGNGSNVDCLGILPVVTTAANAMAIAQEISSVNMSSLDKDEIYNVVNLFEPLDSIDYISSVVDAKVYTDWGVNNQKDIEDFWSVGPKTVYGANTVNSISKVASQFFPAISYASSASSNPNPSDGMIPFDHNYFSYIGVVVFKISVDRGNGCLNAEPVEAFAGSLLRNARDLRTNSSTFIENIINSTSDYISIYVNENLANQTTENDNVTDEPDPTTDLTGTTILSKNSLLYSVPGTGLILGVPPASVVNKKISFEKITGYMEKVFQAQSNKLASIIDVVVDAGLSTIAECLTREEDGSHVTVEANKLEILNQKDNKKNEGPWTGWRAVINLMKKFCETTRKDCVFVCDAPRFLSLKNQRKIVNPYDMSSVADEILPKIRLISGINTSYGWGYVNWFKIADTATGTSFWCPPSIFGANKYIISRTRWNTWDAPAGMTRGVISVDDTSFEPDLNARNVIYSNSWNYALTDVQNGVTTLEGQKTFQAYQSAFDRINVRSLFLDLERRVFKIARNYIYEPNTADTRQQFVDNITPIFSTTKSEGGCYDYKIIADETLNTPEVIDNNEFRIRIGVQPTKTIEFILMEFVASRTGSDWSELLPSDA